MTACWAWLSGVTPNEPLVGYAESARNLVWIGLLYSLSVATEERQHGLRLVYGAVAAVIGLQLVADALWFVSPSGAIAQNVDLKLADRLPQVRWCWSTISMVRRRLPAARISVLAMLGLAWMWGYDLNLYTTAYLGSSNAALLNDWRGFAVALTAPLFALGARHAGGMADQAITGRDIPVSLAARDLRVLCANGDPSQPP